jgi:glycosyltransferase involved in cell wall biosynthesis
LLRGKSIVDNNLSIPNNVVVHCDTSDELFYNLLKESKIVVLPLNSLAPAGLIVLIRAALLSKPIIATKTPSIKNYIRHLENGILIEMKDYLSLAKNINTLIDSELMRRKYSESLKHYLLNEYSQESYAKKIDIFLKEKWTCQ